MARRYDDEVAWITGGGSGIGAALALELASRGATVAVSGRRQDCLDDVVARIEGAGGKGLAVACDVTDEAQVQAAVARIVDELGALHVVVANAGWALSGKVVDHDADAWHRQLDVNVIGAALTARHAAPHLIASKGRLAFTGSVIVYAMAPGNGLYAASKAAVHALAHTLRAELGKKGVRVTVVHPGFVESEIAQVDNDGVFHADRQDKRPAKLMMSTDKAARAYADGIHSGPRELVITGHGKVAAFLGRHFPGFMTWAISR